MTTLLLANIGNRDVRVGKTAPVPAEVNPVQDKEISRRALGEYLQSHWSECHQHLSLPIIGKTVAAIQQQAGALDGVVLIASDQSSRPDVADSHLQQDTCTLAPVVTRLLAEQYGIDPATVTIWNADQPADYGGMQAFFRHHLPALRDAHPDGLFYLELSGGTPAMTSMLLIVGAEVFGLAARPLYVSEHDEQPYPLDLGRRLVADALKKTVEAALDIYAYHAAARAVRDNLDLLRSFAPADELLAVLEYARQRINFNFDRARAALDDMPTNSDPALRAALETDLQPNQPTWLLHEIVYNAEIRLKTGAYGDFLTRVFRFDEAALRYTAHRLGAMLTDKQGNADADGEFLDPAWLASQPDVDNYLRNKGARRDSEGRISANRMVLTWIVSCLADLRKDQGARDLLKQLEDVNKLSEVRNKSFAVHSFEGVSRQRMAQAVFGPAATGTDAEMGEMVELIRKACETATGQSFERTNPYDDLNARCRDLLRRRP